MDLFSYLGRKILKECASKYAMFPDEKFNEVSDDARFVIYAYFPTKDHQLGTNFVRSIENLYKKFNKAEKFKFNCVLTREGDARFENDEIIEFLNDYENSIDNINKLLV